MTKSKKEENKAHYEKNRDVLIEKARLRRVEAKKEKTFAELMKEFADNIQLAETRYLESVIETTQLTPLQVATIYKQMRDDLKLTDHQRLHIHNNAPVKKLLRQRLKREHQIGELI
ncbi:hypothetical protein A152_0012615 [Vibrio tasmaniensis 1F-187]|uniref:hypothetical protein n=1 Tax=unclassified Vibrio TaxID=2614977 RepID=UPI0002E4419B|nr:hypothetical protein [Vibrio tasmaniensis]OEF71855.1 hypothetical protein A152_13595 [Vibrio tasmaniensis 1F-187]